MHSQNNLGGTLLRMIPRRKQYIKLIPQKRSLPHACGLGSWGKLRSWERVGELGELGELMGDLEGFQTQ